MHTRDIPQRFTWLFMLCYLRGRSKLSSLAELIEEKASGQVFSFVP